MHFHKWLIAALCIVASATLAGCGFHLRQSAVVPQVMQQQVYLQVDGGGEFARSLAAALRASKVTVLDTATQGVATLAVPTAAFSSRMLTSGSVQRVGEYVVGFNVTFTLTDAHGNIVVPAQSLSLSHEFAIDSTQFSAISSETEAVQRSLVREMTDAVMRRLEARAHTIAPASAATLAAPAVAGTLAAPASASSAD
jgi:LPS-assembly lipoprotein